MVILMPMMALILTTTIRAMTRASEKVGCIRKLYGLSGIEEGRERCFLVRVSRDKFNSYIEIA